MKIGNVSDFGRASLTLLLLTMTSAAWPDWRQPDAANLLYAQLLQGEVVMELAPGFAPKNVANIRILAREKYFDGLAIVRSQDNYVAQWADPAEDEDSARSLGTAAATVPAEFERASGELRMTTIESRDAYADVVGFVDGFPAASDGKTTWLAHCYGMVGVARGNEPDSGNGSSLYVVTGHAPRHLDRNITLVGRVISGIENLTTLPRGKAAMGFYESVAETTPIIRVRLGDDIPEEDRLKLEIMRTDSSEFSDYVMSRTTRMEEWFVQPTGRIELCNVHPPVRAID